jgi:hypothetical protein
LTALWVTLLWFVVRPNERITAEPDLERELERPLTDAVR